MGDVVEHSVIECAELLIPGPAQAFGRLLGVPVPDLEDGAGLPLLWHWLYLLDRPAQADLGPDGHLKSGVLAPPQGPALRRMWAGGRVRVTGQLRCGEAAVRRSRVLSVTEKQGRTGRLIFYVVGHQVLQRDRVVVDEQQDIVYREAVATTVGLGDVLTPDPPAVPAAPGEWEIDTSPTLLFRFSALTYNAHRIHYDLDYVRDVEGYQGLLVHGPLQTLAMAEAARAEGCAGDQVIEYRLTSPLLAPQGMVVRASREPDAMVTSVRDRYGRQTASATIRPAG